LQRRPEFARRARLTPDTEPIWPRYLGDIHEPSTSSACTSPKPDATAVGRMSGEQYRLVERCRRHRPRRRQPFVHRRVRRYGGASPFPRRCSTRSCRRGRLRAIWAWEFYQISTYQAAPFNVEPGLSDEIIALLRQAETRSAKYRRSPIGQAAAGRADVAVALRGRSSGRST